MGNRKSRKIGGGEIIYFFDYGRMFGMNSYPKYASLNQTYTTPHGRNLTPTMMSTGEETITKGSSDWVDSYNKSKQKRDMYERLSQEGIFIRQYAPPTVAEGYKPKITRDPVTGFTESMIGGKKSKRKTSKRRKTNKRR
jgi:hypothetical protein